MTATDPLWGFTLLSKISRLFMILNISLSAQIGIPTARLNLNLDGHLLTQPIYINHDLNNTLPAVTRAIISLHGDGQNADQHYSFISNAATTLGLQDSTLIIAPLFLLQEDISQYDLDSTVLFWPSGDWNAGDNSRSTTSNPRPAQLSSFSMMDTLFHRIVNHCPNLESLTLTGHSAGSQMVVRYAAAGRAQQDLEPGNNIQFRYVTTNTPSFLYMDEARVIDENAEIFSFQTPELCWSANYYKYGLDALNSYLEDSGVTFIRDQYFNQDITYLIGQYDTGGQSTNCARDIQGSQRLLRSYIYFGYLGYYYGDAVYETHRLAQLPSVYHDFWQVLNSDCGLKTIFGLGDCNEYVDGPQLYNSPPIAQAGESQIVGFQEDVVLNGSESFDPDGTLTSILWTQIYGTFVTLVNPTSLQASFISPNQNDSLVFQLRVTDDGGLVCLDTTSIRVGSSSAIAGTSSGFSRNISISPNPFNAATRISFPSGQQDLTINIFDILGRKIVSMTQTPEQNQLSSMLWQAKDQNGFDLNRGVYLVYFQSGNQTEIRKVTYLK